MSLNTIAKSLQAQGVQYELVTPNEATASQLDKIFDAIQAENKAVKGNPSYKKEYGNSLEKYGLGKYDNVIKQWIYSYSDPIFVKIPSKGWFELDSGEHSRSATTTRHRNAIREKCGGKSNVTLVTDKKPYSGITVPSKAVSSMAMAGSNNLESHFRYLHVGKDKPKDKFFDEALAAIKEALRKSKNMGVLRAFSEAADDYWNTFVDAYRDYEVSCQRHGLGDRDDEDEDDFDGDCNNNHAEFTNTMDAAMKEFKPYIMKAEQALLGKSKTSKVSKVTAGIKNPIRAKKLKKLIETNKFMRGILTYDFKEIYDSYAEALLWSTTYHGEDPDIDVDEDNDKSFQDLGYDESNLSDATKKQIKDNITEYVKLAIRNPKFKERFVKYYVEEIKAPSQFGHDLALSIAGHGAGFLDYRNAALLYDVIKQARLDDISQSLYANVDGTLSH